MVLETLSISLLKFLQRIYLSLLMEFSEQFKDLDILPDNQLKLPFIHQ
jgi:hypothetical protein